MGDGNGDGRFSCGLWLGDKDQEQPPTQKIQTVFSVPIRIYCSGYGDVVNKQVLPPTEF